MITNRIKAGIAALSPLALFVAMQAKATEFDTLSATDARDVVADVYNVGKDYFLLIIGALLAAGLLITGIFWGYQKVKGLMKARKKV